MGQIGVRTIDEGALSLFSANYDIANQEKAAWPLHLAEYSDVRTRRRRANRRRVHVLAGRILDALGRARHFHSCSDHGLF